MEISIINRAETGTESWPKLPIQPAQEKLWMETRAAVFVNQQAFADVWMRMMQDKDKELAWFTDMIPAAATDDRYMFLNPEKFFKWNLLNRVFVTCHEICHAIFGHCGMMWAFRKQKYILYADGLRLPYNDDMCQKSTDCLINDMLIQGKVGEPPTGPKGEKQYWHGEAGITYQDDIASAYRKFFEQEMGKGKKGVKHYEELKKQGKAPGQGQPGNTPGSNGGKSFDVHLKPGQGRGKTPTQATEERDQQAWDNALAAAIASAKAAGKLHGVLERGLSKLLTPKIDWRDHLSFEFCRALGVDHSTWETLDNELMLRGIGAPGKRKHGCGMVVFATDSSGSINQATCDMFNTEGVGLMEQARPRQLIYIQCDAKVHECVEIDDPSDLVRKIKGGGGTDFRPVFKRVEEEGYEPDLLIYLTDMEGSFPAVAPPYPVIWATTIKHTAPFGAVVEIPKQLSE